MSAALLSSPVWACFCVPSFTTGCENYWSTDTVFVGRVISADPKSAEEVKQKLFASLPHDLSERLEKSWTPSLLREALRYLLPQTEYTPMAKMSDEEVQNVFERKFQTRRVRILVTEPFRGIDDREVAFTSDFSNCSVDFRENESYLIYAWRDKQTDRLQTNVCAGTSRIDKVPEQLKYIRGLKTGETPSRIFGFVTANPTDIQFPVRVSKPLPGVPITVRSGEKSWSAATNQEGKYELVGVPPGSYDIRAVLPNGLPEQALRRFELTAGGCSRQNFLAVQVGTISGRLLDSNGKPISGVLTEIEAIPPTRQPRPIFQKFTDKDGRFEHVQLDAGEYVIGFNLKTPPNARDWYGKRVPYPRSYYPGVTDRAAAQVLRLDGGQMIENLEFRVPRAGSEVVLTGEVLRLDGSPAKAGVWLVDLDFPADACQVDAAETNADGQFSLSGVEGQRYAVFAHVELRERDLHSEVLELPRMDGKPIRLVLSTSTPEQDCEICRRFTHLWQSPLWQTRGQ